VIPPIFDVHALEHPLEKYVRVVLAFGEIGLGDGDLRLGLGNVSEDFGLFDQHFDHAFLILSEPLNNLGNQPDQRHERENAQAFVNEWDQKIEAHNGLGLLDLN
jgi:hypothetical protein